METKKYEITDETKVVIGKSKIHGDANLYGDKLIEGEDIHSVMQDEYNK